MIVKERVEKVLRETAYPSLMYATAKGDLMAVRALAAAGADVGEADPQGFTPVFPAVDAGHLEVVRYLADQGADLSAANANGCTPAFMAAQCGRLDMLRFLGSRGVDVDVPNNMGWSPIIRAAAYGHADVVEYLARRGASLERRHCGGTALGFATQQRQDHVVRLLTSIETAGGWRPYAAARRMPYVRIRH